MPFGPRSTALVLSILAPATVAAGRDTSPQDWREDLGLLLEELEAVHPDPWFHADRDEVLAAASDLDRRLDGMTWEESFAGFHRIVAKLGDGHTRIQWHRNEELGLHRVPIGYALFPEGLFVVAATAEQEELLGGRVVSIGNSPVDDAIAAMQELVAADNEWTVRDRVPEYLTQAELLTGLGIVGSVDECAVEVDKDGRPVQAVVPTVTGEHEPPRKEAGAGAPVPLYRSHPEKSYFFEYLPEQNAVYLHFRRVRDDEGETFEEFCRRAFDFMEEQQVERLVVDLRLNSGGNNYLNRPLVHGIIRNDRIDRDGHLFVIVGRRTFSAAMCGTIDLERQTNALFVGEPTGASPNHHGDAVPILLPHTGITVSISALYWQNSDPRDVRPWLEPDIPVQVRWDDWISGRDPVLETTLSHEWKARRPSAEVLSGWLAEGVALKTAIERWDALRLSDERESYDFGEYQLNAIGYELLGAGRVDDAIAIFELNAERFPRSFNPWDSLGEAYAAAGRRDDAIAAYARSVELNPASRSGQNALRRLRREAG